MPPASCASRWRCPRPRSSCSGWPPPPATAASTSRRSTPSSPPPAPTRRSSLNHSESDMIVRRAGPAARTAPRRRFVNDPGWISMGSMTARGFACRGWLLVAVGLTVAVAAAGDSAAYHASGLLRGALVADRPLPIYAADPEHTWNRVTHLLFTASVPACVSRFYADGPAPVPPPTLDGGASEEARQAAIRGYYRQRFAGRCTRVTRLEGGDV